MFNLLVSADETAWEGAPYTFPVSRCLREYTDDAITAKYGSFDPAAVAELLELPTVLAYEHGVGKAPKFGKLTNISKRPNRLEIRVDYELIPLTRFLTDDELWAMGSELDLGSWESSRTHWAVKDVDLLRELVPKGIVLPPRFSPSLRPQATPARVDVTSHVFEVAFSFPGEYRDLVEATAKETSALLGAHACFYDANYQAQLARPSLDLLLQDIYGRRSKLLVVFVGSDYQRKMWPGIEWNSIRSILTTAKARGRIMYVRVDDGEVGASFRKTATSTRAGSRRRRSQHSLLNGLSSLHRCRPSESMHLRRSSALLSELPQYRRRLPGRRLHVREDAFQVRKCVRGVVPKGLEGEQELVAATWLAFT